MKRPTAAAIAAILILGPNSTAVATSSRGLDDDTEAFSLRLHHDNYVLILKYNPEPNLDPYRPYLHLAPGTDLTSEEAAIQLSFKLKLVNNALRSPVDLWCGYTQQSFWQAYNGKASRPFRETNYQPEAMAVLPIRLSALGVTVRFVGLGAEHQSNGQLALFSRSWNRFYGELGLEAGSVELVTRAWASFGDKSDNPDIEDYMGHGHLTATYRWRGHAFAGLFRYDFNHERGAAQVSWTLPIHPHLKGYLQAFSGYGQSLIDYDALQQTVGAGFLVDY